MSSIESVFTDFLSSTLGLLWNKVGDSKTENFEPQDGDVTDGKIREFVVRELLNIRTTYDDLSCRDLLSSYTLLQEGVQALNATVDKSNLEKKVLTNETKDDGETSTAATVGSNVLNEVMKLSHAVRKIKLNSNKEFEVAKKKFEGARKVATEVISIINTLSIEEKIVAMKLRIVSEMLECLDNPENAITGCLSVLEQLHSLPAIQEILNVYIQHKNLELLNKKCVDNVKSVMLMNFVLFEYVLKFSSNNSALRWPTIELDDLSFNPILHWMLISERKCMGNDLHQHPGRFCIGQEVQPYNVVMNSHSELIVMTPYKAIELISRTGEWLNTVELPELPESENIAEHWIEGLAVDKDNKVYVMRGVKTLDDTNICALYVFNEKFSVIHTCPLDFLRVGEDSTSKMAISKNNFLIISQENDPHVYVCDDTGQLKHKIETNDCEGRPILCISEKGDIVITRDCSQELEIYTKEGNLKARINVPDEHNVLSVAFHHVMCKVIVLTRDYDVLHHLWLYSESGELETTALIRDDFGWCPGVTSHPSGPFAVVTSYHVRFIY